MKWVLTIVGVLAALNGAVWALQGLNVIPGSPMTGDMKWTVYGGALVLVGAALALWAQRRR